MDTNWLEELRPLVEEVAPWAIAIRRELHRWPETGNEEFRTIQKIKNELDSLGIETNLLLNTGLIATVVGVQAETKPERAIAFRADIDGLPIEEKIRLPFTSERKGYMHACGHDVHAAILLGVGKVLTSMKNKPNSTVRLIFQPAEETSGGAVRMISAGCLTNPTIDEVYGLHVKPELTAGTIGIQYGKVHASSDQFLIRIKGNAGHGAAPHTGTDAIVIGAQLINQLQTIVSRNISPLDAAVLTIGTFQSGTAVNIIAKQATLTGTIRALDQGVREILKTRIKDAADGIALATGAEVSVEFTAGYDALTNWKEQTDYVKQIGEYTIGPSQVVEITQPSMGVEDFTYYLKQAKGSFFFLGSGYPHRENSPLHSDHLQINEACINTGILVLSALALAEPVKK